MAALLPSTRAAPIRRFIYLIVSGGFNIHALHRIDTSPLFAAGVGVRAQQELGLPSPPTATLPSPLARFDCANGRQFFPLGRGVEKIVSVDANRHTVIFDTRTESVRAGPDARHVKWHGYVKWHGWGSTWAEAGGTLYHLGRDPGYEAQDYLDFEALTYDPNRDDWFWNLLPSLPLDRYMPIFVDSFADSGAGEAGPGTASAIIRISTNDGTYVFDARVASWRKEGDWALPFHGRAQYVADYGLWFGFADDREFDLCAADLNVAGRPSCRHVWANVDGQASHAYNYNWLESTHLSYLGSGRFCVTRFFRDTDKDGRPITTAFLTAVEATRAAAASATGEMRMVKRASVRYHNPPAGTSSCWAY